MQKCHYFRNLSISSNSSPCPLPNYSTTRNAATTWSAAHASLTLHQPVNKLAIPGSYLQYRPASRLARSLALNPGSTAETYVAYGITQKLFEACSSQADYRIPQASQKGVQVPKIETGEDLGIGQGWWYEGSYNCNLRRYSDSSLCMPFTRRHKINAAAGADF